MKLPVVIHDKPIPEKPEYKQWPQIFAALAVVLCSFTAGAQFTWTSPSLPKILSDDYPVRVSNEMASYITVIAPFGDFVGSPIAASYVDKIGRKLTILLIAVPQIIAWFMYMFLVDPIWLCVARFIAGVADGAMFVVVPMYIGEIAEPKIRGVLGTMLTASLVSGVLAINIVGSYFSISHTAMIMCAFPVLFLVVFSMAPDSPYYYIMVGKLKKAEESLQFLRRCKNVDSEVRRLTTDVERQMSERGTLKDLFTIESNRKALIIMVGLRASQQLSGVGSFSLYTQMIFKQSGSNISESLSTIIYTVVQLVFTFFSSFLMDRYGRKPLLIASCFACGVVLSTIGTFFYAKEAEWAFASLQWVPLTCMLTYIFVFSIGLGAAPNIMLGELFSSSVKAKALSVMNFVFSGAIIVITKFFQVMSDYFGFYVPFFVFSGCCFCAFAFSIVMVPETKGKTLEEIQQYIKGNKKYKTAIDE